MIDDAVVRIYSFTSPDRLLEESSVPGVRVAEGILLDTDGQYLGLKGVDVVVIDTGNMHVHDQDGLAEDWKRLRQLFARLKEGKGLKAVVLKVPEGRGAELESIMLKDELVALRKRDELSIDIEVGMWREDECRPRNYGYVNFLEDMLKRVGGNNLEGNRTSGRERGN